MNNLPINDNNCSGIYKITNKINNKIYIGSSKNLYNRIASHISTLKKNKHCNIYLQNTVKKYGIESLYTEIIEYCDISRLLEREQYWINLLKPEYNLTLKVLRKEHTKDSKNKISISLKKAYKENRIIRILPKKPVDQYDLDGKLIQRYESLQEAAKSMKVSSSVIAASCNGNYLCCKFKWEWKDNIFYYRHPIIIIDLETNNIYKFLSFRLAEEYFKFTKTTISKYLERYGDGIIYKERFAFHDRNYNRKLKVTKFKWKRELKYNKLPQELL